MIDLPTTLRRHKPSTMWGSWPIIRMLSKTDFMENSAQSRPGEVGWRNLLPMWPLDYLLITRAMETMRSKHANQTRPLSASRHQQCCKDWQRLCHARYCPLGPAQTSEGNGATRPTAQRPTKEPHHTTHLGNTVIYLQKLEFPQSWHPKCIIPVICNMSNRHQKHPACACRCPKHHSAWIDHPVDLLLPAQGKIQRHVSLRGPGNFGQ